jgi:hypothetical protein
VVAAVDGDEPLLTAAPLRPPRLAGPTPEHWISVSFREADVGGPWCLGRHADAPVASVTGLLRDLCRMTWAEVEASERYAFKRYHDAELKGARRPPGLAGNVRIGCFRATGRCRVFGYRDERRFVVLWFDPKHRIVPARSR